MRFKVLIAVTMKVSIFWDVTPCNFAGRYCTKISEEPAASIFWVEEYKLAGLRMKTTSTWL